jgi:hypothetical protein
MPKQDTFGPEIHLHRLQVHSVDNVMDEEKGVLGFGWELDIQWILVAHRILWCLACMFGELNLSVTLLDYAYRLLWVNKSRRILGSGTWCELHGLQILSWMGSLKKSASSLNH